MIWMNTTVIKPLSFVRVS